MTPTVACLHPDGAGVALECAGSPDHPQHVPALADQLQARVDREKAGELV